MMVAINVENEKYKFLYELLPELSQNLTKMLRIHGPYDGSLGQIFTIFHYLKTDIERNTIKKEVVLFPLIKEYEATPSEEKLETIHHVIFDIEEEQSDIEELFKELRIFVDQYYMPGEACKTYTRTFEGLQRIDEEMHKLFDEDKDEIYLRIKEQREEN